MDNKLYLCKYKSLGCHACIEKELLNDHYKRCNFTTCNNKYNNKICIEKGNRIDIQKHMNEICPFRIVSCSQKGNCQIPFCELDNHNCVVYLLNIGIQKSKDNQNKNNSSLYKQVCVGHKDHLRYELIIKYMESKQTEVLLKKILDLRILEL